MVFLDGNYQEVILHGKTKLIAYIAICSIMRDMHACMMDSGL